MNFAKVVKADLDSPRREFSNGGLGIVVQGPFGFFGNYFLVCFYWGPNPAVFSLFSLPDVMVVSYTKGLECLPSKVKILHHSPPPPPHCNALPGGAERLLRFPVVGYVEPPVNGWLYRFNQTM